MRRLHLGERRTRAIVGALAVLGVLVVVSLIARPVIEKQNDRADQWATAATEAFLYDADADLNDFAATNPFAFTLVAESQDDLRVLADHQSAVPAEGSAAGRAAQCTEATESLWWPDASGLAERSCAALDERRASLARRDVLDVIRVAFSQACPAAASESDEPTTDDVTLPLAENYPWPPGPDTSPTESRAVLAALDHLDAALRRVSRDCRRTETEDR